MMTEQQTEIAVGAAPLGYSEGAEDRTPRWRRAYPARRTQCGCVAAGVLNLQCLQLLKSS